MTLAATVTDDDVRGAVAAVAPSPEQLLERGMDRLTLKEDRTAVVAVASQRVGPHRRATRRPPYGCYATVRRRRG